MARFFATFAPVATVAAVAAAAILTSNALSATSPLVREIADPLLRGDTDRAIAAGERAVVREPRTSELWEWLGRAYAQRAKTASLFKMPGLAKQCRTAFEKALALDPSNLEVRRDLVEYYAIAPGLVGGSDQKARQQAEAILKADPLRGHTALAFLAIHAKNFPEAEVEYRKALAIDPKSFRARRGLASFLVSRGRADEGRAIWRKALADDPNDAKAHFQLALVALTTGTQLADARQHLAAFLRHPPPADAPPGPEGPTIADAHWRLALIEEKLGRKDVAKAELEEALKIEPDHLLARKDLQRLAA